MSFSITINSVRMDKKYEEPSVQALLEIGDYREELLISLLEWKVEDYIRQWKEGLESLQRFPKSCLITAMRDFKQSDFINWWLLYRVDDTVFFQNQIVLSEESEDFSKDNFYESIPDRSTVNEDGFKISEWKLPYAEIVSFLVGYESKVLF